MPSPPRRFPAPWSVRELGQAFVLSDANGKAVAYTQGRERGAVGANALHMG